MVAVPFSLNVHADLSAEDLQAVAALENLAVLNISGKVSGAGLKELAALKKLQVLSLAGPDITDNEARDLNHRARLRSYSSWA